MAFLEINDLRKSYGNVEILKGINLTLDQGGFLVLIGPSGCGKSTLLNTIAGFEGISVGDIKIDGQSVAGKLPSQRDIAMVFQSYALYPNMTVAQNVAFAMEMRKVPKPEREQAVAKVAKVLQIEHLLGRKPSQLSGGQRQRVAMGRALVRDPKLFLFDEPLSNLDAKLRVDMRIEIKRLHQSTGKTIVYVTHDQIEAMTLATKIAVLKDGILQQIGTPAEIYNQPVNLFVADFMGSPAMNLVDATVSSLNGRPALTLQRPHDEPITLPAPITQKPLIAGSKVILGVRPEAITDPEGADQSARMLARVELKVDVVEPAGADTYVLTAFGGKEVTARMRADVQVNPGQSVPMAINLDKALVFDVTNGMRI